MLRTRAVTALLIAITVLSLLFVLAPMMFALVSALVLLGVGGWEAGRLAGLTSQIGSCIFGAALVIAGLLLGSSAGLIPDRGGLPPGLSLSIPQLLIAPAILWLLLAAWLTHPALGSGRGAVWRPVKLIVLAMVLLAAWLAMAWLQSRSPWLVVLLIVIIAAADTGAYFTGRALGGPKLAPRISPGKTWSGVVGGLVATVVVSTLIASLAPEPPFKPLWAGVIALALAGISICGDLFMSLLKRQRGLKDSSRLLPGHGGILDRIDSLGAALPFFALAIAYLAT
jgi:phosphatidate cytidylyltransferase